MKKTLRITLVLCVFAIMLSCFGVFAAKCSNSSLNAGGSGKVGWATTTINSSHSAYNPYVTAKATGTVRLSNGSSTIYNATQQSGSTYAYSSWTYSGSSSISSFTNTNNVWSTLCGNCGNGNGTFYG